MAEQTAVEQQVTIYTMEGCPHCAAAKRFLREHDVAFEEFDVYESEEIWEEASPNSSSSCERRNSEGVSSVEKADGNDIVPVIDLGGHVIYGAWSDIRDDLAAAVEGQDN